MFHRRFVFCFSIFFLSFTFISAAFASGSEKYSTDLSTGGYVLVTAITVGATTTLIANTMSVIRWKRPHPAWLVGGFLGGFLAFGNGMALSGIMGPNAAVPIYYNTLILMPGNLVMATWATFLPDDEVEVSIGSMPMIDTRGAMVPGIGLKFARF